MFQRQSWPTGRSMMEGNQMTPGPTISRMLAAGVLVGVLDGAFAVVLYAYVLRLCSGPQVFQSIAGALLGPAAFRGGGTTAPLGLLVHFTVAGGWPLVYARLWTRSPPLRQ